MSRKSYSSFLNEMDHLIFRSILSVNQTLFELQYQSSAKNWSSQVFAHSTSSSIHWQNSPSRVQSAAMYDFWCLGFNRCNFRHIGRWPTHLIHNKLSYWCLQHRCIDKRFCANGSKEKFKSWSFTIDDSLLINHHNLTAYS